MPTFLEQKSLQTLNHIHLLTGQSILAHQKLFGHSTSHMLKLAAILSQYNLLLEMIRYPTKTLFALKMLWTQAGTLAAQNSPAQFLVSYKLKTHN